MSQQFFLFLALSFPSARLSGQAAFASSVCCLLCRFQGLPTRLQQRILRLARALSAQEAEEEDSEATRVAGLKGFNKLWHKMGNKVTFPPRPQCFGGPPSAPSGDPKAQVCRGDVSSLPTLGCPSVAAVLVPAFLWMYQGIVSRPPN